jgi:lysine N6-hydroxylase
MSHLETDNVYDVIGIGLGPFNLGLAALIEEGTDLNTIFLEQKPEFEWHGGLLIEETTLQVPFLADVVTMVNPKSHYSFLNYLHEMDRLYKFYFLERFHIPRREYNHYCKWVSKQLSNCQFETRVESIEHDKTQQLFRIETIQMKTGKNNTFYAKDVVLGIGSSPVMPANLKAQEGKDLFHSAQFLHHRERLREANSITVIGSGQSAAEVFLELLKEQPNYQYKLDWFTRSKGFHPMEYSKLGLEHFSPEYINYFYKLPQSVKDVQLPKQDLLYKGISAQTISDIYDLLYEHSIGGDKPDVRLLAKTEVTDVVRIENGFTLHCNQWEQNERFEHKSEVIIAATGYSHPIPPFIKNVESIINWDQEARYQITHDYELKLKELTDNRLFVQSGEMHTHGVGAPDLGLGAYRNAVIINKLAHKEVYPVRKRNVFQQFGVLT